jgi:hypothetical protein
MVAYIDTSLIVELYIEAVGDPTTHNIEILADIHLMMGFKNVNNDLTTKYLRSVSNLKYRHVDIVTPLFAYAMRHGLIQGESKSVRYVSRHLKWEGKLAGRPPAERHKQLAHAWTNASFVFFYSNFRLLCSNFVVMFWLFAFSWAHAWAHE